MYDIFSCGRGRVLLDSEDIYGRVFSETRVKTSEHNIYERSGKRLSPKNENSQKSTEIGENGR